MSVARLGWLVVCSICAFAQADPVVQAAREYRQMHEGEIVAGFMELLAIPNVAADPANLRRNADTIVKLLQKRGITAKLLEHGTAPPVVYGEHIQPGASRTVLFYAHYDGSAVSPKDWATPPFEPVLRSGPLEKDGKVMSLPPARFDP